MIASMTTHETTTPFIFIQAEAICDRGNREGARIKRPSLWGSAENDPDIPENVVLWLCRSLDGLDYHIVSQGTAERISRDARVIIETAVLATWLA